VSETPRRPDEPDQLRGERPDEYRPERLDEYRPERPDEYRAERRLTRSRSNRIIAGLCAGLGYYFGVDPVAIRIAFVVLALAGGGGVLLYVLGWIFIPEEEPGAAPPPSPAHPAASGDSPRIIIGSVLVAVGVILLLNIAFPGVWRFFWPVALIAVGVAIILETSTRGR
jgi:phage shock protein C